MKNSHFYNPNYTGIETIIVKKKLRLRVLCNFFRKKNIDVK